MNYRTSIGAAMLGALLSTGAASASFNAQPAYVINSERATLRLEGQSQLGKRTNLYGFLDMDAPKGSADLGSSYGCARLTRNIRGPLNVAAEYETGSGCEDGIRFGAAVAGKPDDKTFTALRFYPIETSGAGKGPQFHAFGSRDLGKGVSACGTVRYNPKSGTFYLEPEVDVDLGNGFTGFVQARGFGKPEKMQPEGLVGIKYNF